MNLYQPTISGSLTVSGSVEIIGPFTMSGGTISGTSSFAANAGLLQGLDSTSFVGTGSFNSMSSSVSTRVTKIEGNYATTGSNIFTGAQTVCANITSTGTIIAQTLNVQQVTSSVVYSSGSNTFGNELSNNQVFTGSMFITGSNVIFNVDRIGINCDGVNNRTVVVKATPTRCLPIEVIDATGIHSIYVFPNNGGTTNTISGNYLSGGVYRPLAISNRECFTDFVLCGGNVGIGCSNPSYALDVKGASGTISRITDGTSHMTFYAGSGLNEIATVSPMLLTVNGCERVRISSTGNVGIGCSNPQAKLDIVRGSSGDNIRLIGSGASDYSDIVIYSTNNSTRLGYIDFSNTQARINIEANIPLTMYTSGSERLSILNNGRVIINQGNTSYHQVSIKSNGNLTYNGLAVYACVNDRFISVNHNGAAAYIEVENAGSGVFTDLVLRTGANDRVYITSCGCVGIGTCAPGSTLHVKGGTQAGADFGSELRVWENNFGAQVQGSTIGNTYAFFGTFRYNFANAANSRSNYYASGYGLVMKDGVGIFSSTAGGSTCTGCTFTPNQRLFIATTGEACFSCQICTPGVNITSNPIGVEYLLVGGGGGGGYDVGGGGGAGGVLRGSTGLYPGVYNISIGAGAAGSSRSCHVDGCPSADRGNNSYAIGLTAVGGGGGGNYAGGQGGHGASGGGAVGYGAVSSGGLFMFGSGCAGGDAISSYSTGGTGGGGGGAAGAGCPSACALTGCTPGGPGILSSIIGSSCSFGCGGRGGGDSWQGAANGPANSGYGGDGAGSAPGTGSNIGMNGGSGIFVIKMLCSNSATFSGGLTTTTCTNVLGYRIYVVTAGTGTMTIS